MDKRRNAHQSMLYIKGAVVDPRAIKMTIEFVEGYDTQRTHEHFAPDYIHHIALPGKLNMFFCFHVVHHGFETSATNGRLVEARGDLQVHRTTPSSSNRKQHSKRHTGAGAKRLDIVRYIYIYTRFFSGK